MAAVIGQGSVVIDATVGNGHDTVFLAKRVGAEGKVFGFDIQEEALAKTRLLLDQEELRERVRLIRANHTDMADHLSHETRGEVRAIMFNLGYLPGGDKSLITKPGDTIDALKAAYSLLRPGGIITIVCYRGHPGGCQEYIAVGDWASSLYTKESIVECAEIPQNQKSKSAPLLFIIEKTKE